jgi:hypothetical protein
MNDRVRTKKRIMDYSVFLKIFSSWEAIAAIVCVMIVLPIAFFLASLDRKPVIVKRRVLKRKNKKIQKKEKNKGMRTSAHMENKERKVESERMKGNVKGEGDEKKIEEENA